MPPDIRMDFDVAGNSGLGLLLRPSGVDDVNDVPTEELTVPLYMRSKKQGGSVFVAQHQNYDYRGADLAIMCLYEYCCAIVIRKLSAAQLELFSLPTGVSNVVDDNNGDDVALDTVDGGFGGDEEGDNHDVGDCDEDAVGGDDDNVSSLSGASVLKKTGPKNLRCFRFEKGHPLYETHGQFLSKRFRIPIISGVHVPKYPGARVEGAKWRAAAALFASHMLVMFRPWTTERPYPNSVTPTGYQPLIIHRPEVDMSWDSFCDWVGDAHKHEDEWLSKVRVEVTPDNSTIPADKEPWISWRLICVRNISTGLSVDSLQKKALTALRFKDADRWVNKDDVCVLYCCCATLSTKVFTCYV